MKIPHCPEGRMIGGSRRQQLRPARTGDQDKDFDALDPAFISHTLVSHTGSA